MRRYYLVLVTTLLLAQGCVIAVPMHECGRPETLGAGTVRYQVLGMGYSPDISLLPPEYIPETDTQFGGSSGSFQRSLTVGVFDNFDLELEASETGANDGWRGGIKYQWKGTDHYFPRTRQVSSAAIAVRYIRTSGTAGNSEADRSPDPWQGTATISSLQVSAPFGYRATTWLSGFAGPRLAAGKVSISYTRDAEPGIDHFIEKRYSGFGAFAGFAIHPTFRWIGLELLFEVYGMFLPPDTGSKRILHTGANLGLAIPLSLRGLFLESPS